MPKMARYWRIYANDDTARLSSFMEKKRNNIRRSTSPDLRDFGTTDQFDCLAIAEKLTRMSTRLSSMPLTSKTTPAI